MLTSMSYHEYINKVRKTTVNSHENYQNGFPFQVRTVFPPNLHQIQPLATQVWNCDKIGLDPNVKWHKVVCTYRYFKSKIMLKAQTGERAPFWCTLLFFTQADRKLFMPPVVVCQAKEYSQDLHHNIPLD